MGADYYVDTYLVVVDNDNNSYDVFIDRRQGWFNFVADSDSEDDEDRKISDLFKRLTTSKLIYKDDVFLITARAKVEFYTNLIKTKLLIKNPLKSSEDYEFNCEAKLKSFEDILTITKIETPQL